jgi:tRNA (guanine-N7-)-methyltransferase
MRTRRAACYLATVPSQVPIRYAALARRAPAGDTFDLGALIPGAGELELEIGYGLGRFLFERAAARPDVRIVGIEIKAKLAHHVEERRKKLGLTNALGLFADARDFLVRARPDRSLARAYLHFPDPWWKKRHAKRRVLDELFLTEMRRLLRADGTLFVQTDVEERAAEMRERLERAGFRVEALEANPFGARSNREARADEDGLPVWRLLGRP